jgi:hypothetical protein
LEAADIDLDRGWTQANAQFDIGSSEWAGAVRAVLASYARDTAGVVDCLERQAAHARAAGNERLAEAYRAEEERIEQRVAGLRSRVQ